MAELLIVYSEFEYLLQELVHVEVVDVIIDELHHWQDAFVKVTQYIQEAFDIILATSRCQSNHWVRSKQAIAKEGPNFLKLLVLTATIEDLRY